MNILFIVGCSFPSGEASSTRALNLVRLLNLCGYHVHVISDYKGKECTDVPCTYESVSEKYGNLFDKNKIHINSIKMVKKYCNNNKVDVILMNAKSDRCSIIIEFARLKKIRIIIENCEWYHYSNYKLKLLDYRYWKNQKMMYIDFKKANGFISISRLLQKRNNTLAKSIRIPTILDTNNIKYRIKKENSETVNLVYTGNPGKTKELLAPIINILSNNKELRKKITLSIYGVDLKKILRNKNVTEKSIKKAGSSIKIYGRVSQNIIPEILCSSDYLIFIRPIRKSSNAGFPTKLGESMSSGTPVITNITGDIDLYVKNNINGFLFEKDNYEELEKILYKIINIKQEEYEKIRLESRKTAEKYFDYRKYKNEIISLFTEEYNDR